MFMLLPSALALAWGAAIADEQHRQSDICPGEHSLLRPIIDLTADDQLAGTARAKQQQQQAEINIDSTHPRQAITGFGGAFTDASCYIVNQLSKENRSALLQKLFGETGLSLNFCRTTIGASDYSRSLYGYDEGSPDPGLKRFSIKHDESYIIPVLKEALAVNRNIFLFSSPWSPPGWMKANKSMLGGSMRRKYMPSYAAYFARFIKEYAGHGVDIQAVTVQNEVDTDQDGKMPACIWPQEYEVDFVRQNLAPLFKKEGIKTKIWIIDHNYNLWGRALSSLELADLRSVVDAVAWHGYVGDAGAMSRVHDAYPDIGAYWTEGGPDISDPQYEGDYCKWGAKFSEILNNWAQGICVWNLALDDKGRPNIGPFPCGGLLTVAADGKIVESGQFKALKHFAPYIKRGAHRLDSFVSAKAGPNSTSKVNSLAAAAFLNPDGSKVLVLTNESDVPLSVSVTEGKERVSIDLPGKSMETLVW